jgi:hypothetical protein
MVRPTPSVYDELVLPNAVPDPIKSHVDSLGPALFYGLIYDASRAGIVHLDWRQRLRMTQIFKRCTEPGSIFGIIEEGAHFGFCGGGEHDPHDTAGHVDRAIDGGRRAVGERRGSRVLRAGA